MPAYDFKCPDGHITEIRFKFTDTLPDSVQCGEILNLGGNPAYGPDYCLTVAKRQWYGKNLVITYGEDGMAPPSQRMKGQGSY